MSDSIAVAPIHLTIDTNCINTRGGLPGMTQLEVWAQEGKLILNATFRLRVETANYVPAKTKTQRMNYVSEPMHWDIGCWDEAYFDGSGPEFEQVAKVLFPTIKPTSAALGTNKVNDVMHLISHASSGATIFVTNNAKDFIVGGRRETLKILFGITVMTDDEAVTYLSSAFGWSM